MAGIRAQFDPRSILFEPMQPDVDVRPLETVAGVTGISRDGSSWNIALREGADPAAVIRDLAAALPPSRIEVRRPTLEEIFIAIVDISTPGAGDDRTRLLASLRENSHTPEVKR
jgi:ABC-type uncharacterized transport system ATPase subunit